MNNISQNTTNPKFAIRFGLGAIKAVGLKMTETAVEERNKNGKFSDVYDFCTRLDPKLINKKSIEALSKSGAFDDFKISRSQIAESFDILSAYASQFNEAKNSNQMSLFGSVNESIPKPPLKKTANWSKFEKLQNEFESFGFFLNEHPLDDSLNDLKKRGIIFSNMINEDDLEDNSIVKMAGVVLASKHRSSARGRFAYLNISDPLGIFEATIFDEALITNSRDLLNDGSTIAIECLIRKDEGGTRIMIKAVDNIKNFIETTKANDKDFVDIKKLPKKNPPKKPYNSTDPDNNKSLSVNNLEKNTKSYKSTIANNASPKVSVSSPKIIEKLFLIISDKSVIKPLKTILEQKINDALDNPKIIFKVITKEKIIEISLPQIYKIKEIDIFRLQNFNPNLKIEVEYTPQNPN